MKMKFELLPAELQLQIFSNLENTDLKAARAVSRRLRDNASPALFRSVVACARYVALGTFQKIALDPILQKYVKEIVFDGSVYNQEVALFQQEYERQNSHYEELRSICSFWSLRTRFKRYQELYNEQEDLKTSGVLLQTIARALDWTTNVSSIVYSPHQHLLRPEAKLMRDLVPRDVPKNIRGAHIRPPQHPFLILIEAIHLSQYTGIRELRVEPSREKEPGNPFTYDDFFDSPDETSVRAGRHLFKNLERCELNLGIRTVWPGNEGISRFAHLSQLLAAAENLRHLALHNTDWPSCPPLPYLRSGQPVFSRLGLGNTWPKLRTTSLQGVHSDGVDFLDFVNRQKCTLRSLSIQDCTLYTGLWADIVDEVVYSTSFSTFVLGSVNEEQVPTGNGDGSVHASKGLSNWLYEGHLYVCPDRERKFVDLDPKKKSVYYRTL